MKSKEKQLVNAAKDLVLCIRNFELGDYSPLMDEIFDLEHAIREYEPDFNGNAKADKVALKLLHK